MKFYSLILFAAIPAMLSAFGMKGEKQTIIVNDRVNMTAERAKSTVEELPLKVAELKRMNEASDELGRLLQSARWKKAKAGFRYPDFMKHQAMEGNDDLGIYDTYSWHRVMFSYRFFGAWATMDDAFPQPDVEIAPFVNIRSITYRFPRKGVWSGYTQDGRIFYLKRKIDHDGEVDHARVLVVVYPEKYKKSATRLVKMVNEW